MSNVVSLIQTSWTTVFASRLMRGKGLRSYVDGLFEERVDRKSGYEDPTERHSYINIPQRRHNPLFFFFSFPILDASSQLLISGLWVPDTGYNSRVVFFLGETAIIASPSFDTVHNTIHSEKLLHSPVSSLREDEGVVRWTSPERSAEGWFVLLS